jgi:hypothetical protein
VENSITKVTVNGKAVDVLDAEGNFFTMVQINHGQNVFSFVATDQFNQTATTGLTLIGQPAGTIDFDSLLENPSAKPVYGRTSFVEKDNTLWVDLAIRNGGTVAMQQPILADVREISDLTVTVRNRDGAFPDGSPYFNYSSLVGDGILSAGEVSSSKPVAFSNPNRKQFDFDLGFSSKVNQAPMFSTVPIVSAKVGQAYSYDANATDPENNTLTFALVTAPAGMGINASSGLINWTPAAGQVGTNRVVLKVLDGNGGSATESFTITVGPIT